MSTIRTILSCARLRCEPTRVHAGLADAPGGPLPSGVQRDAQARRQLHAAVHAAGPLHRGHACSRSNAFRSTQRSCSPTYSPYPTRWASDCRSPRARVRGSRVRSPTRPRSRALAVPDMSKLRYVFDAVASIKRALARPRAAHRLLGKPVHARLLHDRRLAAARTSRACGRCSMRGRTCCIASCRSTPRRWPSIWSQQVAARRRRGHDLRHLGRAAHAGQLRSILAGLYVRSPAIDCTRGRRRRTCRPSSSPRAAASGSSASPPVVRAPSVSTGPPTWRRLARASVRASRFRATSTRVVLHEHAEGHGGRRESHHRRRERIAGSHLQPRSWHPSQNAAGQRRGTGRLCPPGIAREWAEGHNKLIPRRVRSARSRACIGSPRG